MMHSGETSLSMRGFFFFFFCVSFVRFGPVERVSRVDGRFGKQLILNGLLHINQFVLQIKRRV